MVETRLPADAEAVKALRQKVEGYHMRLILDVGYPRDEAGLAAFDANVKAASECGAISLHAAMTGRRYEDMNSLEEFRQNFERCQKSIALAEPILRKHRMRLGIENHKGWRSAEQAAWLKRVSSEWVGVHFDFGNNISLCEEPAVTLKNLLPYTVASHIKDMAVQPYEEGFLLSEVPLGEGILDIKGMVSTLREKDPKMPFDLEMITRDPLKIPVLTDKYWVTFDDTYSPLPGRDLAKIVELVNRNRPKNPLAAHHRHEPGSAVEARRRVHLEIHRLRARDRRLNGRRLASRRSHHFHEDFASFLAGSHFARKVHALSVDALAGFQANVEAEPVHRGHRRFLRCLSREMARDQDQRFRVIRIHVADDARAGLRQRVRLRGRVIRGRHPAHHAETANEIYARNFEAEIREVRIILPGLRVRVSWQDTTPAPRRHWLLPRYPPG